MDSLMSSALSTAVAEEHRHRTMEAELVRTCAHPSRFKYLACCALQCSMLHTQTLRPDYDSSTGCACTLPSHVICVDPRLPIHVLQDFNVKLAEKAGALEVLYWIAE